MKLFETEVLEVVKETSDSYSVKLKVPEGYTWTHGQHTIWQFVDYKVAEDDRPMRVFSIASSPEDGYLMFTTRIAEPHTSWKDIVLTKLKAGDKMEVAEAKGTFDFDIKDTKKSFALAGGIGITPIRSMLKYYSEHDPADHQFTVIYSDDRGEFCYEEDFKEITSKMPNLDLKLVSVRDEMNALMDAYVKENGNDAEYLIAGSPGMNAAITDVIVGKGIDKDHIKTDNFLGY